MSSRQLLILFMVVAPGGVLVVERAGLQAAVQDADQPVAQLPEGGVVAGDQLPAAVVVVHPRARVAHMRPDRLAVEGALCAAPHSGMALRPPPSQPCRCSS